MSLLSAGRWPGSARRALAQIAVLVMAVLISACASTAPVVQSTDGSMRRLRLAALPDFRRDRGSRQRMMGAKRSSRRAGDRIPLRTIPQNPSAPTMAHWSQRRFHRSGPLQLCANALNQLHGREKRYFSRLFGPMGVRPGNLSSPLSSI